MSEHGSRGWEATDAGWRCTECRQEVVGPIDVAIDDAHVCNPPARSRAEAEKAITAVLAEHRMKFDHRGDMLGCACGDDTTWTDTQHRAHVASVLADLMAATSTLADVGSN